MSEIKFRAWHPYSNKMLYNVIFDPSDIYDKNTNPHGLIYSQFAGFYDKNGTEIYEGDIIKVIDEVKGLIERYHGNLEVSWLGINGCDWNWETTYDNTHLIEVVGNIYEERTKY